jgi:hypothetical protein
MEMDGKCPECGALLGEGETCRDQFHALLLLEYEVASDPAEVAGGRGEIAHFYAVSSYLLQHPDGMNVTAGTVAGVRRNLADHLAGRASLPELLRRVRQAADGAARVTRRPGDEVVHWPVVAWPLTIADVLAGGVPGYADRVATWAESILRTLDAACP